MRTFPLVCLLVCGFASAVLHAQQAAQQSTPRPVPPPGPWLEKAPDFSQWTIIYKNPGVPIAPKAGDKASSTPAAGSSSTAAQSDKPKPEITDYQTVVVKTKPIRYERTVVGGARSMVKWFLPDLQISMEAGNVPVVTYANSKNATDHGKTDFPGFEWIAAGNYEGVQKVSGQDCLVFREPLKVDGQLIKSDTPLMSVACIGIDSHMPVALQSGDETRTYTFGQAPNAPLTLPPDVEALAAQWRNTVRQASRPVAKP